MRFWIWVHTSELLKTALISLSMVSVVFMGATFMAFITHLLFGLNNFNDKAAAIVLFPLIPLLVVTTMKAIADRKTQPLRDLYKI